MGGEVPAGFLSHLGKVPDMEKRITPMRSQTEFDIVAELEAARKTFPNPEHLFAALTKKVGNLAKAFLDEPSERIYKEAKQVAALAIRIMEEGDPAFTNLRVRRKLPMNSGKGGN